MQSTHHISNLPFPLWQFLTQPLFSTTKVILNPFQFWNQYSIEYLERCWKRDSIQLLERCWMKELEVENPSN